MTGEKANMKVGGRVIELGMVGPGQEIASILSIGIMAFFAIFSGTFTS